MHTVEQVNAGKKAAANKAIVYLERVLVQANIQVYADKICLHIMYVHCTAWDSFNEPTCELKLSNISDFLNLGSFRTNYQTHSKFYIKKQVWNPGKKLH